MHRRIAGEHRWRCFDSGLFIVLVVCSIAVLGYGRIDFTLDSYLRWDLHRYRAMAATAPRFSMEVESPYVYRILGPYIAGLLPMPVPQAFYMLTVLFSLFLSGLFYKFLRYMKISPGTSALAVVLFILNKYWFGFAVWDYFQLCDVVSLCVLVILFWSMITGRWSVYGVSLLIGVTTREWALLIIPATFLYLWENGKTRIEWRNAILAMLTGVVAFIALHLLVHSSQPGVGLVGQFMRGSRIQASKPSVWFRLLLNAATPASLLPIIFIGRTLEFFSKRKYMLIYILIVFMSTFFGSDIERLAAPNFVVYYLLVAYIIQDSLRQQGWVLIVLILCALAASLHHERSAYPLPARIYTRVISLSSLFLATSALIVFRWRQHRQQPR